MTTRQGLTLGVGLISATLRAGHSSGIGLAKYLTFVDGAIFKVDKCSAFANAHTRSIASSDRRAACMYFGF